MKRLRKQAKELLHAANKIYHYRMDVIHEGRLIELERAVREVHSLSKGDDPSKLKASMDRLDGLLKKIGGKMYPKTFWNDNIEVALVAMILVIGVRTFFFQPFIIPTNSMYPTYSGMNAVIYDQEEGAPSQIDKFLRLATLGARHKSIVAQTSGQVRLPVIGYGQDEQPRFFRQPVDGRKFFVLPTKRAKFTIFVDDVPHSVTVPMEFEAEMHAVLARAFNVDGIRARSIPGNSNFAMLELPQTVEEGQDVLRFDITLGDALFVDRLTYHFRNPKAGEPIVFRTDPILDAVGEATGDYTPKYYIKRLAGVEGETLEIDEGVLLVDGQPRDEVEAFERNARREGEYSGYINTQLLAEGRSFKIPEDSVFALGDNSANSADSRYWGVAPEKAVIGKALFIYYPFTKRWGLAE